MSIDVKWNVLGLKELTEALDELVTKDAKRILGKAAREAMIPVQLSVALNTGYDENATDEHMRENVKMSTKYGFKKEGKNSSVAVRVGFRGIHAQKAIAQEYGTARQEDKPFMRPALYDNKQEIVSKFSDVVGEGIYKAKKKYARKARKVAREAERAAQGN